MTIVGLDIGSTTVKAVVADDAGSAAGDGGLSVRWQDYRRHDTKQAETVLAFLARIEAACGLVPGETRIYATGSGAGIVAPLIGARFVQEVVAVSAAVERLHPQVRFVCEIGGEDMKTIFFADAGDGRSKQVYMQSACSGGTGTFIEKTARKLQVEPARLAASAYDGMALHRISSKCGIFAEADANTLVKAGVPVDEIIASLYEAVVCQNLATLTKGNTPQPEVLLLGGPNLFFAGLQQAWRHHLGRLWRERGVALPPGRDVDSLVQVPTQALYYACLGCVETARGESPDQGRYTGRARLAHWIEAGQWEAKAAEGARGLLRDEADRAAFLARYGSPAVHRPPPVPATRPTGDGAAPTHAAEGGDAAAPTHAAKGSDGIVIGCDFGSTTAKAVVLSRRRELLFSCYCPSDGNPIEDAKSLFRQIRAAGHVTVASLAITGYGKDLLDQVIGADLAIVETVAHATSALHVAPEADVICDVGGCDVKIMILRQGTVADFRLNSQCSSGNGAFLQGVAERYGVPLDDYADRAFQARAVPSLAMGCGVFLQSDIVNQQRKGWSADEIMASLAAVLPLNVWVYAGQLHNLAAAGRRFVLQGGTHRNLAVVKAQVDFIRAKVPDAEITVHPHSGEAGAIGAALCAADRLDAVPAGGVAATSRFRGFDTIAALEHTSTTSDATVCRWCPVNCQRSFIDVRLPGAAGRPWSQVPLAEGWQRVISGNSCPKGLVEDAREMRVVKSRLEQAKAAHPNIADLVRDGAFKRAKVLA